MPPEADNEAARVALAPWNVSRETFSALSAYVDRLRQWQQTTNLVAQATLNDIWQRHVADSLQFRRLAPQAMRWADLGSGGGFPGIVVAIEAKETRGARVDLVESNNKKAAFLRAVIRELDLPANVHAIRIEDAGAVLGGADAVSARALSHLGALCGMVAGRIGPQVPCFFAKGRNHGEEIVDASRQWRFRMIKHPSRVEDGAAILELCRIERLAG